VQRASTIIDVRRVAIVGEGRRRSDDGSTARDPAGIELKRAIAMSIAAQVSRA
jgi:hypothetical protein